LLDSTSLSLGFSSAGSTSCSDIYNMALKIHAIRALGVKKYTPRNLFLDIREVLILESKEYSTSSEKMDKDLLGLLVGNNREASVEV
jgi:hypothetical protein